MEAKTLNRLLLVIVEFRKIDPQFPPQTAAVFVYVCAHEGCSIMDLERGLGITNSSASRNARALTPTHRSGKVGYGLIEARADFEDARIKRLFLTPQGRRIGETLSHLMED